VSRRSSDDLTGAIRKRCCAYDEHQTAAATSLNHTVLWRMLSRAREQDLMQQRPPEIVHPRLYFDARKRERESIATLAYDFFFCPLFVLFTLFLLVSFIALSVDSGEREKERRHYRRTRKNEKSQIVTVRYSMHLLYWDRRATASVYSCYSCAST